jgi:ABC-type uncharacterized transport system substrate-binding protein
MIFNQMMRGIYLGLLVSLWPLATLAHPHAWIELKSTVLTNTDGDITGIHMTWVNDEYYTEIIAEDFGYLKDGHIDEKELAHLAKESLKNLKDYQYFCFIEADGKPQTITHTQNSKTWMEGKQVVLSFAVMLKNPINPSAQKFLYRIYDPSYYIEMLHGRGATFGFDKPSPLGCTLKKIRPNPNFSEVSLASALDKSETAPDNMGRIFAETMVVACPNP